MKINASAWTIVLAGNWNKSILSPEWAAKHIFNVEKLRIEVAINNINLAPRLSSPDVVMMLAENAVIFMPLQQSDDYLIKAEQFAHNLISKLPYTPMSAFGINFGFIEESPEDELLELFNFSDRSKLSDSGCELKESTIGRRLLVDEKKILNFTINSTEAAMDFNFNFHYDVTGAEYAKEILSNQVIANKALAYKMLKEIYNLEVQE